MTCAKAKAARAVLAMSALASLGGCIDVNVPDKPIEINLNINITQEVVVRLTQDVQELRRQNPENF